MQGRKSRCDMDTLLTSHARRVAVQRPRAHPVPRRVLEAGIRPTSKKSEGVRECSREPLLEVALLPAQLFLFLLISARILQRLAGKRARRSRQPSPGQL